jgi:hypothetical protein
VTAELTDVCPEDFLRAGAVFGQVAEQLTTGMAQCRQSASVEWQGPPGQAYQQDLEELSSDLGKVQRAFDSACDALLAYARSLVDVRDLAVRARSLGAQAEQLEALRMTPYFLGGAELQGPVTPEQERLQAQSRVLYEAALRAESTASTRLAGQLRGLAADAPRTSGGQRFNRGVANFAKGADEQVQGTLAMVGHAYLSLPLLGTAQEREVSRQALKQELLAMAQPWLGIEAMLQQLRDGEYAHVGGSLSAGLFMRKLGVIGGKKLDTFGTLDDLPSPVLRAMYVAGHGPDLEATAVWLEQHAQATFTAELERLQSVALPDVEDLIANGANLMLQEAHGGHTLLKHVGRDIDILRRRQREEPDHTGAPVAKSTFRSLVEAQEVVAEALEANQEELRAWVADPDPPTRPFRATLSQSAGLVLDKSGHLSAGRTAVLVLRRNPDGTTRIISAYLES